MFIAHSQLGPLEGVPTLSFEDVERLRTSSWRDLRELARRHRVHIRGLRTKAEVAVALLASPAAPSILRELRSEKFAEPDVEQLQNQLAVTRDSIREAANLGAGIAGAEEAWKEATGFLERRALVRAREAVERASQRATEAKERRLKEIEDALSSVQDHLAAAKVVGADVSAAEALRERAQAAVAAREYVEAGDLIKQAERLAMQAQQRQIEQAIQLKERQIATARAIVASCEPLLLEAESYDLNVTDVRTLLRQARDVLAKGDYIAGLTFARNAEEAAYQLSSQIDEERRRRGVARPAVGLCGVCGGGHLTFYEDGWGRCADCQTEFRWRGHLGIRERVRGILGT